MSLATRQDTMDLRELGAALRDRYRWIIGGAAAGVLAALLLAAVLPRTYSARATVLLRSSAPNPGALLGASAPEGLGGLAAALGGSSGFETELEVLGSRAVMEPIVDSLHLQVRVTEPKGVPNGVLFAGIQTPPDVKEGRYSFRRTDAGYRVRGPELSVVAAPGATVSLGGARLTLRRALPKEFEVELADRETAVNDAVDALHVERRNGDVAELRFSARDSLTAAAVPNAVIAGYLTRRRTVDRGVNQTRYDLLTVKTDSVARELASAEDALRRAQEQSGVVEPAQYGKSQLEEVVRLRGILNGLEAESRALRRMADGERISPREIAGFPTLMSNPAINNALDRLMELDEKRTTLLERRTEADPDVVALTGSIRQLEGELGSLASNYLTGLSNQQSEVRTNLLRHTQVLAALPAQSEIILRLQREVQRLGETYVVLQTQLVQLRLAAVGEGGEVRMLDAALPPRAPSFPNLPIGLAIGLLGGLFFGSAAALGAAQLRRELRHPWEAELAVGAPAVALREGAPLLLGSPEWSGTLLVVPVGRDARAGLVARRLAATAGLRGKAVALVELDAADAAPVDVSRALPRAPGSQPGSTPTSLSIPENGAGGDYLVYRAAGAGERELRDHLRELESQFSVVVVAARTLEDPTTAALLGASRPVVIAARSGGVSHAALQDSVATLGRMGVPLMGVVMDPEPRPGRWSRAAARA